MTSTHDNGTHSSGTHESAGSTARWVAHALSGLPAKAEHGLEAPVPDPCSKASDQLGKYIGETEQAIAGMFVEAKRKKALLLLDEADTFLGNLDSAVMRRFDFKLHFDYLTEA